MQRPCGPLKGLVPTTGTNPSPAPSAQFRELWDALMERHEGAELGLGVGPGRALVAAEHLAGFMPRPVRDPRLGLAERQRQARLSAVAGSGLPLTQLLPESLVHCLARRKRSRHVGIENNNVGALCIPLGVLATDATGEVVFGTHVGVLLVSLAHTFSAHGVQPF